MHAITVAADTQNLAAYELYLEGRSWFLSRKDVARSIELLKASVALDPEFARAWETLGAAYSVADGWGVPEEGLSEKAREASQRALELNANLSMARAVLGAEYIERDHDLIRGMAQLDQAIENDPLNATAWFWRGIHFGTLGFVDRGIEDISHCIELDPAYWNCYRHLARLYLIKGDLQETLDTYQVNLAQGVSINDFWIVPVYLEHGMEQAANQVVMSESRGDPAYPGAELIAALKDPGRDNSGAVARLDQWNRNQGLDPSWRGAEWVALGAYERVGPNIDNNRIWTPLYAGFRASRYFKPLVKAIGLHTYWRAQGFPPMCRPLGADDFECDQ